MVRHSFVPGEPKRYVAIAQSDIPHSNARLRMLKVVTLSTVLAVLTTCSAYAQLDRGIGSLGDRIAGAASRVRSRTFEFANDPIVYWPSTIEMKVIQVVDEGNAILSVGEVYNNVVPVWVWYKGKTTGMSDGLKGSDVGMTHVIEEGTKQYRTAAGSTKTLRVLRSIDKAEFAKLFPDAVSLTTKDGVSALVSIVSLKSSTLSIRDCKTGRVSKVRISIFNKASKDIARAKAKEIKKRAKEKKTQLKNEGDKKLAT